MSKIENIIKEGMLVNRSWLCRHGIDRSSVDYYIREKILEAVTRGVYRKPGPPLKWQNVVYSLNELGYSVHVGHISALRFHGFQHYLMFSDNEEIFLYCNLMLPDWIQKIENNIILKQLKRNPFPAGYNKGFTKIPFGPWDWPITYSEAERAFIELISTVDSSADISQAEAMFEGAANFRPDLVQLLLENCIQVKAKRLFLWMAKKYDHSWYKKLDMNRINIGSGKRQIVKAGILDKEFMITVPREKDYGDTEPLF